VGDLLEGLVVDLHLLRLMRMVDRHAVWNAGRRQMRRLGVSTPELVAVLMRLWLWLAGATLVGLRAGLLCSLDQGSVDA
jgi:hypothetical protein